MHTMIIINYSMAIMTIVNHKILIIGIIRVMGLSRRLEMGQPIGQGRLEGKVWKNWGGEKRGRE